MKKQSIAGVMTLTMLVSACALQVSSVVAMPDPIARGAYGGQGEPGYAVAENYADVDIPITTPRLKPGERVLVIYAGSRPDGSYRASASVERYGQSTAQFTCAVDRETGDGDVAFTQAITTPWVAYRVPADIETIQVKDCSPHQWGVNAVPKRLSPEREMRDGSTIKP